MGEFQYPERIEAPERLSREQFRNIYSDSLRVLESLEAPALMSFGPSILDLDGALDEGFINDPREFQPQLKITDIGDIDTEIEGSAYTAASFFFKMGGNEAASKKWLGYIRFSNGVELLEYELSTAGTIKMKKTTSESRWVQRKMATAAEGDELLSNLEYLKQSLRWSKNGQRLLRAVA